ncbi:MAG: undecaprenyl-diphosphate phosphatase, partial [Clostridia bacterium]|nr:undecaprenyl-diphosphate phosphatase [Clostridia bacterium]
NLSNIYSVYDTITNINISYKQAILIGLTQGIAVIPGVSRSGSTIATALITRVDKHNATKYSFLISIPIVIASGIMQIIDIIVNTPSLNFDIASIVICFMVCLVVGLLAIKLCTKIVNSNKLYIFSYYLIGLIILILILMFI